MSRIGKKVITIPDKTEITVSGSLVTVKGPKGTLQKAFSPMIGVTIENKTVTVQPKGNEDVESLRGTAVSHLENMIEGVNQAFTKKLIIEGIGYKADVRGTDLVLALGFSHPVVMKIPQTLKVVSDKGIVTITGADKEEVGHFAAVLRAYKKPEPYKGKGIRYETEVIRRKQGKKAV